MATQTERRAERQKLINSSWVIMRRRGHKVRYFNTETAQWSEWERTKPKQTVDDVMEDLEALTIPDLWVQIEKQNPNLTRPSKKARKQVLVSWLAWAMLR